MRNINNYNVSAGDFLQCLYDNTCDSQQAFDAAVFRFNHNLINNPDQMQHALALCEGELQHRKIVSNRTDRKGNKHHLTTCLAISHSIGGSVEYFCATEHLINGKHSSTTMRVGGRFSDPYTAIDAIVDQIEIAHPMILPLRFARNTKKTKDDRGRVARLVREYLLPTKPLPTASWVERFRYYKQCACAMVRGY